MRHVKHAVLFLAAHLLVGSIALTYDPGDQSGVASEVEVRFGALAAGSSGGANASEATASAAGSLLGARTDLLYLNNTNATGAWFVKIESVGATGASNIASLTVGIDNGTASTPQVVGALGALTQSSGSYVRLAPASANRIYVTQSVVSLVGPDTRLTLNVISADDAAGSAYVITNANVTVT